MVTNGALERDQQQQLREAAVAAVMRGWPVVPGTTFSTDGRWHGRDGATQLAPISETWRTEVITGWADAHRTWSQRPHGLLLACSADVHAVEVPKKLGQQLCDPLADKDLLGPTVEVHPARWAFLVEPGPPGLPVRPLAALRDSQDRVTYRETGHWVPLPPTGLGHEPAVWVFPPNGRRLPPAPHVLQVVVDVTNANGLR